MTVQKMRSALVWEIFTAGSMVLYEDGEMFIYSKKGCGTAVQLAFTPKDIV